jgi:hypothetical protein
MVLSPVRLAAAVTAELICTGSRCCAQRGVDAATQAQRKAAPDAYGAEAGSHPMGREPRPRRATPLTGVKRRQAMRSPPEVRAEVMRPVQVDRPVGRGLGSRLRLRRQLLSPKIAVR